MKPRDRYYVKFGNIVHALRGTGRRLNHRRIGLFWTVAVVSLTLPWAIRSYWLPTRPAAAGQSHDVCAVLSIYDGDTMTVSCAGRKTRVRLYCIDAPEMGQEPWGRESRDHLRAMVGSLVRVAARNRDRYGRTVAEVFSENRNLNLAQVRAGWALMYRRYCRSKTYANAEADAHFANLGVWNSPGPQRAPWAWRHRVE